MPKSLGIPEDKWVYLHGCADAYDHWFISDRHNYHSSPAMRIVARETLEMAECGIDDIAKFDLYSCFPSAVEIACREMGIDPADQRGSRLRADCLTLVGLVTTTSRIPLLK